MADATGGASILSGEPGSGGEAGPGEGGNGGAGAPAEGGGEQPAAAPWTAGLEEEARGYAETKGWKSPGDLLQSYRSLEKLHGAPPESLLRLPGKDAKPEDWEPVYARLGRPSDPKDYEFGQGIISEGETDLEPAFRSAAHEAGLSQTQAGRLFEWYNGQIEEALARNEQVASEKSAADEQAMRREWGAAFEENIQAGRRFATRVGWDNDTLEQLDRAMGTRWLLETTAKLGRALGEAAPPGDAGDRPAPFGMTPGRAQARIAELRSDPAWVKRYLNDAEVGHKEAVEEMTRLQQLANPPEST